MEKNILEQLVVYSILDNKLQHKKIYKLLENALGVNDRKELEKRISELEEEKKELQNIIDSCKKIQSNHEEEIRNLKDKKKFLDKENAKLKQEVSELRSERDVLKSKSKEEDNSD